MNSEFAVAESKQPRPSALPRKAEPRAADLRSAACPLSDAHFAPALILIHLLSLPFHSFNMGRLRRSRTHHAQRDVHRASRTRVRCEAGDPPVEMLTEMPT